MAYDQTQLSELLTHYGKIDALFLDGEAVGLRELAWKLNPNIIVTRGAINTPDSLSRNADSRRVGSLHHHGHLVAIPAG